ncbi:Erp5p SCDLUD_003200 [Saccharomycodes ludwigii]|uniref:Erp5p n=1 Tax=Saccharomycodes ludwigii TaxID=36035 RepID=UPI001E824CE2|nr:hypothetical protein SCDLUD_003200 [Saccharomycodes ludwigii]KAH3900229.1 hypothetical protein SCDLUD_003200 [Saccharomycodes ludwigii]
MVKLFPGALVLSIIVILLSINITSALYVYIPRGESKCFFEELAKDSLISGALKAQIGVEDTGNIQGKLKYIDTQDISIEITVDETFDNNQRVFSQKISNIGEFTFTALDTGEHEICIKPIINSKEPIINSNTNSNIRLFVDFSLGNVQSLDSRKKKTLSNLKDRVDQLTARLQNIKSEQTIIRDRETKFRDESEAVNSKIVFWSIIQIFILISMCIFQLRYLRSFFVKQKIV